MHVVTKVRKWSLNFVVFCCCLELGNRVYPHWKKSVLTMSVFVSLREERFEKLLPKLKVGEHATLLKLWDTKLTSASREV